MPKHQTLHKEVKINVNRLRAHKFIKRISIGPYENCRHKYRPGVLKFQRETSSGWKINGYDGSGIYTLYIYLEQPESIEQRNSIAMYMKKFS